jgi:multidrug efflux pump subunit AcrB
MTATTIALLLALLLLPLLVLLWATESTEQRTKRLNSYGWSQRRIADHLHITRYRVRMALTFMITNPWVNRITALVVLLAVYAAGYAGGRDAATMARLNHPACNTNLKP